MPEPGGSYSADRYYLSRNSAKRPWNISEIEPNETIGELYLGVSALLVKFGELKARDFPYATREDLNDVFNLLSNDMERLVQLSLRSDYRRTGISGKTTFGA